MPLKLPRVKKGEPITAEIWNAISDALEAGQVIAGSGLRTIETPQGRILTPIPGKAAGGGAKGEHPFKVWATSGEGTLALRVTPGVVIDTVEPFPDFAQMESIISGFADRLTSAVSQIVSSGDGSVQNIDDLKQLIENILEFERGNFRDYTPFITGVPMDEDGVGDPPHAPYLYPWASGNVWLRVRVKGVESLTQPIDMSVDPDNLELIFNKDDEDPQNTEFESYVKIAHVDVADDGNGKLRVTRIDQLIGSAIFNPLRDDSILDMMAKALSFLLSLLFALLNAILGGLEGLWSLIDELRNLLDQLKKIIDSLFDCTGNISVNSIATQIISLPGICVEGAPKSTIIDPEGVVSTEAAFLSNFKAGEIKAQANALTALIKVSANLVDVFAQDAPYGSSNRTGAALQAVPGVEGSIGAFVTGKYGIEGRANANFSKLRVDWNDGVALAQILCKSDEASFWLQSSDGNNFSWKNGTLHGWRSDGAEYKLYNSDLYLQNASGAWLNIQTSTIFMHDGQSAGSLYPAGASLGDGACVIDGAAIFLEGETNWSQAGIWFNGGNTGLADGYVHVNGQTFVPRDFTDCDGNTITVLATA